MATMTMTEEEQLQHAIALSKMDSQAPKNRPPVSTGPASLPGSQQRPLTPSGDPAARPAWGSATPAGALPARPQATLSGGLPARNIATLSGGLPMPGSSSYPMPGLPSADPVVPALALPAPTSIVTAPQLTAQLGLPGPGDVDLGAECDKEIDRLVREKLEGGFTGRVYAQHRYEGMSGYHNSFAGQCEGGFREAAWTVWSGLVNGPMVLLGRASAVTDSIGINTACTKVSKAVPIIFVCGNEPEDDDFDDNWHMAPPTYLTAQQPRDEFGHLVSVPLACKATNANAHMGVRNPVSAGCSQDVARTFTGEARNSSASNSIALAPQGAWSVASGGSTPATPPAVPMPASSGRRSGDNASALSVSSAMTSSAASILGGLGVGSNVRGGASGSAARPAPVQTEAAGAQGNATAASSAESYAGVGRPASNRTKQAGEAKSVLAASSGLTSSAASALGGISASNAGGKRPGGDAKTVVSGIGGSSSAASGLLGPLLQQGVGKQSRKGSEAQSVIAS